MQRAYLPVCAASAIAMVLLGGCAVLGDAAGVVVAVASGTFTQDPALALTLAITAKAATDEASRWVARNAQHAEQEAIARASATLKPGEAARWHVRHRFPPRTVGGEVRLVRVIDSPLARCREVLFNVDGAGDPRPTPWFLATTCADKGQWSWAVAEPAVERWDSLE